MAAELVLKLIDSSSKECEVTGRMMGSDDTYTIPFKLLHVGYVHWPQAGDPNHSVKVESLGADFVEVSITAVSRGVRGPQKLFVGEKISESYMFGEWSYGYTLSLASAEADGRLDYERALEEAHKQEKKMVRANGKINYDAYCQTKNLYTEAARLGSSEAFAWLVNDALTHLISYRGKQLYTRPVSVSEALELVEQAESLGVGGRAREIYESRPDLSIQEGVLYGLLRDKKRVVVPDGVTKISEYAFSRTSVESITIPASVTTIEPRVFMDAHNLKEVVIHGSVTIGEYAFCDCNNLKELHIEGPAVIDSHVFRDCSSLDEVVLPAGSICAPGGKFEDYPKITIKE